MPARALPSLGPLAGLRGRLTAAMPVVVALAAVLYIDHLEARAMRQMDGVVAQLYEAGLISAASAQAAGVGSIVERYRAATTAGAGAKSPERWVSLGALEKGAAAAAGEAGAAAAAAAAPPPVAQAEAAAPPPPAAAAAAAAAAPMVRAPKPKIFDLTDVAKRASALVAGGGDAALAAGVAPPPPGVAWPPLALPGACFNGLGYNKTADAECYWLMDAIHQRESALDPHYPLCWGRSRAKDAPASPVEPLVFHVLALPPVAAPPALQLLLTSFVATQCCDAELWLWAPPDGGALANATAAVAALGLPPAHAGRVLVKPLDVPALWAAVRPALVNADGKSVTASSTGKAAASDKSVPDADAVAAVLDAGGAAGDAEARLIRRVAWLKLLLLAAHGGVYADRDVVLLRDWRPLFGVPRFGSRAGFNIFLAGTVLRLPRLASGDAWTRRILRSVLVSGEAAAHLISSEPTAIGLAKLGDPAAVALLAESLFDMTWFRYMGEKHEHYSLYSVHPEFTRERSWHALFDDAHDELSAALATEPFMRGSFAYHWHGSEHHVEGARTKGLYHLGIPPRSWAGALLRRYQAMAADKAAVCAAAGA